jgi:DNA polymerase III epsilon subunit-like protein
LLVPFGGALVTLFIGLVGWRIQLIGKRRTELAEEALLAFSQAVDSIRAIRQRAAWNAEIEEMRKEANGDPSKELPGEPYLRTLVRIRREHEKFLPLRKLQLLCRLHFGADAAVAFEAIEDALREIQVAAEMCIETAAHPAVTDEDTRQRREWRAAIWAGGKDDAITPRLEAAHERLEAALAPHLR